MAHAHEGKIGIRTAIIIGLNAMIGAGIFSITSLLGSKVGPAGILTYLCAFGAVWFIAQSFARIAYLYPQEGSFYTYAKQLGGHTLGVISAGSYLFGLLVAMGLLCKICGMYMHGIIPSMSAHSLGLIILISLILLNMVGVIISQIGQYILIAFTIYPLAITSILCLSKIDCANLTPFMPYGPLSVIMGTKVAIFGLFGFESIASLYSVMKNPETGVPRALRYSMICVGIIYLIFIGSILLAIPQDLFAAHPNITIPQALLMLFPHQEALTQSVGISIIFAIIGTIHAMIWSSSELMVSCFKFLKAKWVIKAIQKKYITQRSCVLIAGAILLTAFLSINNLAIFFSLADVCLIFAFITAIAPLLALKNEWKSGQNYMTLIGLASALIIFAVALEALIKNLITWFL